MSKEVNGVRLKEVNITTLSGGEELKNGRHGIDITQESTDYEKSGGCCCFCLKENTDDNFVRESEMLKQQHQTPECCGDLRGFFHSVLYYVFVLVLTLVLAIFLVSELFVDLLRPKVVTDDKAGEEMDKSLESVGVSLHYISLAIISLFFTEVLFKVFLWRTSIVNDWLMVIDCIIITFSFFTIVLLTIFLSPSSVYDSTALIIIFRFVHIYSIIKLSPRRSRYLPKDSERLENELQSTQSEVQRLFQQIADKDFEIKQLQAHLGETQINDQEVTKAWQKAKEGSFPRAASKPKPEDNDIQRAIELSKQEYEKETNGSSITHTNSSTLDRSDVETDDGYYSVIVHHTRNSFKRREEDDFSDTIELANTNNNSNTNQSNPNKETNFFILEKDSLSPSSGEINYGYQLTPLNRPPSSPINVCIDPSILNCEGSPLRNSQHIAATAFNFSESNVPNKSNTEQVPSLLHDFGYQSEDISSGSLNSSKKSITTNC